MNAGKTFERLRRIENGILALLVLLLVGLSGAQILLRIFFETGLSWADPFLRGLVLWTGMLGALAAVRDERHIALDLLQRYLTRDRTAHRARRHARIHGAGLRGDGLVLPALVRIDYAEGLQTGGGSVSRGTACMLFRKHSANRFRLDGVALRPAHVRAAPAHTPALMHQIQAPGE